MGPVRLVLREANVTEQQWRILRVLSDSGELDMTQLAQLTILHASSLTRILRQLGRRGLVIRRADSVDGRRTFVCVTDTGRDLVESTLAETRGLSERYEGLFGSERLAGLRMELIALADILANDAAQRNEPHIKMQQRRKAARSVRA